MKTKLPMHLESENTLFFVIVFALSSLFWMTGYFYPVKLLPGLPLSSLMVFCPAGTALFLVYKRKKVQGFLELLGRSIDYKRITKETVYFAILLIKPGIYILVYISMLISGRELPVYEFPGLKLFPMFIGFFAAAIGEELGWTGFALIKLQTNLGILKAGLLLGIIWSFWHLIPFLQADRSLTWIFWQFITLLSFRILLVWIYNISGKSVFAAALFHSTGNLCWQIFPNNGSYYDPALAGIISTLFVILIFSYRSYKIRMHNNGV